MSENNQPGAVEALEDTAARDGRQPNRITGARVEHNVRGLPHAQAKAILWLHGHYWDTRISLAEIGRLIGYDGATVSKIFHGGYDGDIGKVTESIEAFRATVAGTEDDDRLPFIETSLSREIRECAQLAATHRSIVFVYGESQIGKTRALEDIAAKSGGKYIYWEMPVGGALSHAMASLAEVRKVSRGLRTEVLMSEIAQSFGRDDVLLIDEAARIHQSRAYGGSSTKTLDWLRSLHDARRFGMLFAGTKVFREGMEDKQQEKFLNQMNRRCLLRRQLSDVPAEEDLDAFARYFGLPPASGAALALQTSIVAKSGLGVWIKTLRTGATKAQLRRVPMTWDHAIKAEAFFRSLEKASKAAPAVPAREERAA